MHQQTLRMFIEKSHFVFFRIFKKFDHFTSDEKQLSDRSLRGWYGGDDKWQLKAAVWATKVSEG